jgi:hypothetical protein
LKKNWDVASVLKSQDARLKQLERIASPNIDHAHALFGHGGRFTQSRKLFVHAGLVVQKAILQFPARSRGACAEALQEFR